MEAAIDPLIEIAELEDILAKGTRNVRIVDACFYPPKDPRDSPTEYKKECIPGYRYFFKV